MKLILFGHRGIGKSSLLERMQNYFSFLSQDNCICIDAEVERELGSSIKDYMEQKGEACFRERERKALFQWADSFSHVENAVLALGAGYDGEFPPGWKVLWVQRAVDAKNFIFSNRPSLASDGSLRLPEHRYLDREKYYGQVSDLEIELLEHRDQHCPAEKSYFSALFKKMPLGVEENLFVTLSSKALGNDNFSSELGVELRDDWLNKEEMEFALRVSNIKKIVSFRDFDKKEQTYELISNCDEDVLWDWPMEWGECPYGTPPILSLHRPEKDWVETLKSFDHSQSLLKLAVPINSFQELRQGYDWFKKDPSKRIFLPSSENGRWQWFRQLIALQMPFSFVREGRGSSPDQPTLLQSLLFDPTVKNGGAVLGSPVKHSLTPWLQRNVFGNALAVDIQPVEWEEALAFLAELGITRAAVTSPLKESAYSSIANREEWSDCQSINTLQFFARKWWGANTDIVGFQKLCEDIKTKKVAVWGGGGTLGAIRHEIPEASFYSSRTGELKEGIEFSPEVLIWAVGAENFARRGVMPPKSWAPRQVIDLNYSEDSPGIACAHTYDCQYTSGLSMFVAQGEAQQEFWKQYERK